MIKDEQRRQDEWQRAFYSEWAARENKRDEANRIMVASMYSWMQDHASTAGPGNNSTTTNVEERGGKFFVSCLFFFFN
jgi:hypothetical protein